MIGFKKTYYIGMGLMIGAIFLPFFSNGSLPVLMAGQIISGIPWGMFQTLSVAYASEVCPGMYVFCPCLLDANESPVCLRGYLCTYANICWVIGQILASGVLRGMLSVSGEWSYKIPFALQWIFPPPILVGLIFAPESPWVSSSLCTDLRQRLEANIRDSGSSDTGNWRRLQRSS